MINWTKVFLSYGDEDDYDDGGEGSGNDQQVYVII